MLGKTAVRLVGPGQDHRIAAQGQGPTKRHTRMQAKPPGLIRTRSNTPTTDNNRPPPQSGHQQLLHRSKKRVNINMENQFVHKTWQLATGNCERQNLTARGVQFVRPNGFGFCRCRCQLPVANCQLPRR
jgi:hypothetical protein